jgi:hypothetical protein
MSGGYSRTVSFAGVAGAPVCVELPAPPRGVLDRLIVTQTTGTPGSGTVSVYDRKGACVGETDLNVAESGAVTSSANSGGFIAITFAADHNLKVGDTFEVKGHTAASVNTTHTVTSVASSTVVVTNISFVGVGTGGVWQTLPFLPTANPASHLVYEGTMSAGALKAFDIDRGYENRDNQSSTMRARYQALWLEFTPANSGDYEVAVTAETDNPT